MRFFAIALAVLADIGRYSDGIPRPDSHFLMDLALMFAIFEVADRLKPPLPPQGGLNKEEKDSK
jgi:hypothetical protein